ncbi:MAG TPA: hypothetical protein VFC31_01880 [Candidatus Limnocylindria bacterium]|nr:hypothetical protein [Candidatus Limnocylindria bacterium]
MSEIAPDPHKADVHALIESYDEIVRRALETIAHLENELAPARASGDDRYLRRVEKAIARCRSILAVIDEQVEPLLMDLRHNAAQLGFARDGKLV